MKKKPKEKKKSWRTLNNPTILKMTNNSKKIKMKECSKCKEFEWVLPNGLCMSCDMQNLKQ